MRSASIGDSIAGRQRSAGCAVSELCTSLTSPFSMPIANQEINLAVRSMLFMMEGCCGKAISSPPSGVTRSA